MIQELLTSFLLQSPECNLPGLGSFSVAVKPARLDVANKVLFPPVEEYSFSEKAGPVTELFRKYVAMKTRLGEEEAAEKIKTWSKACRERILRGENVILPEIGALSHDQAGNISFEPFQNENLFTPVTAERVIHKDSRHAMLVGDKETTSDEMNEILNRDTETKKRDLFWKIAALILLLGAAGMIFYYYYHNQTTGIGNGQKFKPATPPDTYISK